MAKRRFKKAKISFISLCPAGKNQMETVFKSDDSFAWDMLTKAAEDFNESGEVMGVVIAPDRHDYDGDIADASVIKQMCYSFAEEGMNVDLRHNNKPVPREDAYVAQNFIIQKGDPRFADLKDVDGKPVDAAGGWGVVIQVNKEDLRAKYREGEWKGISMGGVAAFEVEKSAPSTVDALLAGIASFFTKSKNGDLDMNAAELQKMLDSQVSAIVTGISKALGKTEAKPEDKPEDKPVEKEVDPDRPVFEGSRSDAKAVKAHAVKLRHYDLTKAVDKAFDADPKVLDSAVKALETFEKAHPELASTEDGEEEPTQKESPDESAKHSRQPLAGGGNQKTAAGQSFMPLGVSISKENVDAASKAAEAGRAFQAARTGKKA